VLHTEQTADVDSWVDAVTSQQSAQSQLDVSTVLASHIVEWDTVWSRSYVDVMAPSGGNYSQSTLDAINTHYVWQRFLDLCDGRGESAIKFNGQSFTVNVGSGPDYRDWGASYW
jgi:hypothetical protein